MNEENNMTCTEASCTEAVEDSKPLTTAQPVWHARKTDDGVEVEVTLPGVRKDDLELQVEGRELRLNARRHQPSGDRRLLVGRPAPDNYALKLRLGESLEGDRLSAALKDGLLTIKVPLAVEALPKTITIN